MLKDLKEDIMQYKEMLACYEEMQPTDLLEAYEYSKKFLVMADRWSEIAFNASKYCVEMECSKTDSYNWAYQKYRNLQLLHEFCRVVYRQGTDSLKNDDYS